MDLDRDDLKDLYEQSFKDVHEGSIIKGTVIAVMDDSIVLDIGYKSEGFVPLDEFSEAEQKEIKPGDQFDVYIQKLRDSEGTVSLSRNRALRIKAFNRLQTYYKEGTPVKGIITEPVKGGFYVEIEGTKAFLPGSQLDIKPMKDSSSLLGKEFDFRIIKLNPKMSNIIVSRRALIEEERKSLREETVKHITEGAVLNGTVKNITDYGVFVDLGGIDGLLHISDISWGRISHPSEVFKVGDTVDVIVLQYNAETDKVTLGYKQHRPDPWSDVDTKYPAGAKVKGKITSITDYGAFLEIEEGVEGLIHISEFDWSPRPKHPSKYVSKGEEIEAVVLRSKSTERRLSLSIRELKPKPWDLVAKNYVVGQKISARIRSLTEFGAFVGLPEGVDALIHISDISWTRHIKHPSEVLKRGQTVDAVILSIDTAHEKMALGIKQLKEDPWEKDIPERYTVGEVVTCRVLRMTDFGIFVEINDEVEGLVYASETEPSGTEPGEGETITARIIKIEPEERKIGLSMKNIPSQSTGEEQETPE